MNKRPATIYKHTALGTTEDFIRSLVAPAKPRLQLLQLAHYFPVFLGSLRRQADFAMLVGQRASIGQFESPLNQVQVSVNIPVIHQRLANVVHLPATILPRGIGQEQNGFEGNRPGRKIV